MRVSVIVYSVILLSIVSLSSSATINNYIIPWTAQFFGLGPYSNDTRDLFCEFENGTSPSPNATLYNFYLCLPNPSIPNSFQVKYGDSVSFNASNESHRLKAVQSDWTTEIIYWETTLLPATLVGNESIGPGLPIQEVKFSPPSNGLIHFIDLENPYIFMRMAVGCYDNKDRCSAALDSESSSSDGLSDTEENYSQFLSWLTLILLWISIGGALMTILTFTVHYDIRTYPIKLIMYLCVCIVVGNFFFLMGYEYRFKLDDGLCFLTAGTIHGFFLANFCWTLCIAINFHQMIVKRNREPEGLEKWYHFGAWGFPIFCVQWTAGFLKYGDTGGLCYINNNIFIFVFFFTPGLLIISTNCILFVFVVREIRETLSSAPKSEKNEMMKEMRVYFSIFVSIGLSWIFGFIGVIFTVTVINLIFNTLFTIFTCLQGFLIFVFYCINFKVLGKWAGLMGKCIPFFRRFENMDSRRTTSSGRTGTSRSTSRMNSGTSGTSMNSMDSGASGADDADD